MNRKVQPPQQSTSCCTGYSLLELLTVLTLFCLILLVGIPTLSHSVQNYQANNNIESLKKSLEFSRTQAISLKQIVTACPIKNNKCVNKSDSEFLIFIDQNKNRQFDLNETKLRHVHITDNQSYFILKAAFGRSYIRFKNTGEVMETASISYCSEKDDIFGRVIKVNGAGRVYHIKNQSEVELALKC